MRTTMEVRLALCAMLAATAGCASAGGARFAEARYVCEGGRSFTAEITPTRATVKLPEGRTYQLQRTQRMGADHYTDGRVNFFADRRAARLVTPEAFYSYCRRTSVE